MKVGFITFEKASNRDRNSIGSSRIRAHWVAKYWDEAEEWRIGAKYDVLIFQKVYWDEMLDNYNGIKILDLCDPDWLEGHDVMKYIDKVDAVTTSTQALADYIKKFSPDKRIVCIPDRIDFEAHKDIKQTHNESLKNLVWFGYSRNFIYLERTFEILAKKGMNLTVISDSQINPKEEYPGLQLQWRKYNYETLHEDLIKYDCALFPSQREKIDYRGKFKSNNKNLTCWALGLPVIELPEDFDRLSTKDAREKEAKEKLELVRTEYNVTKSVEEYKLLINTLWQKKKQLKEK